MEAQGFCAYNHRMQFDEVSFGVIRFLPGAVAFARVSLPRAGISRAACYAFAGGVPLTTPGCIALCRVRALPSGGRLAHP